MDKIERFSKRPKSAEPSNIKTRILRKLQAKKSNQTHFEVEIYRNRCSSAELYRKDELENSENEDSMFNTHSFSTNNLLGLNTEIFSHEKADTDYYGRPLYSKFIFPENDSTLPHQQQSDRVLEPSLEEIIQQNHKNYEEFKRTTSPPRKIPMRSYNSKTPQILRKRTEERPLFQTKDGPEKTHIQTKEVSESTTFQTKDLSEVSTVSVCQEVGKFGEKDNEGITEKTRSTNITKEGKENNQIKVVSKQTQNDNESACNETADESKCEDTEKENIIISEVIQVKDNDHTENRSELNHKGGNDSDKTNDTKSFKDTSHAETISAAIIEKTENTNDISVDEKVISDENIISKQEGPNQDERRNNQLNSGIEQRVHDSQNLPNIPKSSNLPETDTQQVIQEIKTTHYLSQDNERRTNILDIFTVEAKDKEHNTQTVKPIAYPKTIEKDTEPRKSRSRIRNIIARKRNCVSPSPLPHAPETRRSKSCPPSCSKCDTSDCTNAICCINSVTPFDDKTRSSPHFDNLEHLHAKYGNVFRFNLTKRNCVSPSSIEDVITSQPKATISTGITPIEDYDNILEDDNTVFIAQGESDHQNIDENVVVYSNSKDDEYQAGNKNDKSSTEFVRAIEKELVNEDISNEGENTDSKLPSNHEVKIFDDRKCLEEAMHHPNQTPEVELHKSCCVKKICVEEQSEDQVDDSKLQSLTPDKQMQTSGITNDKATQLSPRNCSGRVSNFPSILTTNIPDISLKQTEDSEIKGRQEKMDSGNTKELTINVEEDSLKESSNGSQEDTLPADVCHTPIMPLTCTSFGGKIGEDYHGGNASSIDNSIASTEEKMKCKNDDVEGKTGSLCENNQTKPEMPSEILPNKPKNNQSESCKVGSTVDEVKSKKGIPPYRCRSPDSVVSIANSKSEGSKRLYSKTLKIGSEDSDTKEVKKLGKKCRSISSAHQERQRLGTPLTLILYVKKKCQAKIRKIMATKSRPSTPKDLDYDELEVQESEQNGIDQGQAEEINTDKDNSLKTEKALKYPTEATRNKEQQPQENMVRLDGFSRLDPRRTRHHGPVVIPFPEATLKVIGWSSGASETITTQNIQTQGEDEGMCKITRAEFKRLQDQVRDVSFNLRNRFRTSAYQKLYQQPHPTPLENATQLYRSQLAASLRAFKPKEWPPLNSQELETSYLRCKPINCQNDSNSSLPSKCCSRKSRPKSVPPSAFRNRPQQKRPDTPTDVRPGNFDSLNPKVLSHLLGDSLTTSTYGIVPQNINDEDETGNRDDQSKEAKDDDVSTSGIESTPTDDTSTEDDEDDSDYEPEVDENRLAPELYLRPEKLDSLLLPDSAKGWKKFDFDADNINIPVYAFANPLPDPFHDLDLRQIARLKWNWRDQTRIRTREKNVDDILDRMVELERLQMETEDWEQKRTAQVNKRFSKRAVSAKNPRDRRCCSRCTQPACTGDCPEKSVQSEICELCRQPFCVKTLCTDSKYDQRMRQSRIEEKLPNPRTPNPKYCKSCQSKHNAKLINANNIVLGRPKSCNSTYSRGQSSNKPKDYRPTTPVSVDLFQEFDKLGIDPQQPSRPTTAKSQRPRSRNSSFPSKSFYSQRRDSLTEADKNRFKKKLQKGKVLVRRPKTAV